MTSNMEYEHIKDMCFLISETFNLSIFFINPIGEIPFECSTNVLNPLYQNEKQNLFNLLKFEPTKQFAFPVGRKTIFRENFISISVRRNDRFDGTVLVGPTVYHRLSDEEINGVINDTQAFRDKKELANFYH